MTVSSSLAGSAATSQSAAALPARSGGITARVWAAVAKARALQAQREVDRFLARQPDRLLRDMGLDDTAIADLRRKYDL